MKRKLMVLCIMAVSVTACNTGDSEQIDQDPENNEQQPNEVQVEEDAEAREESLDLKVSQNDKYGRFLTDGEGRALYMFKADTEGNSNCYDACTEAWPPLTADGELKIGKQLDHSMVGSIKRKNGETQITYAGWPLYYYVKDQQQGQFSGQDIKDHGAEWYLISPQGNEVHAESGEDH